MACGNAIGIELGKGKRSELEGLVRRRTTPQALALRAPIVFMAANGRTNVAIWDALRLGKHIVAK